MAVCRRKQADRLDAVFESTLQKQNSGRQFLRPCMPAPPDGLEAACRKQSAKAKDKSSAHSGRADESNQTGSKQHAVCGSNGKDDCLGGGCAGMYNQTGAMPQPANPLLKLNGTLWDKVLQQLFGPMVASGLFGARRSPPRLTLLPSAAKTAYDTQGTRSLCVACGGKARLACR